MLRCKWRRVQVLRSPFSTDPFSGHTSLCPFLGTGEPRGQRWDLISNIGLTSLDLIHGWRYRFFNSGTLTGGVVLVSLHPSSLIKKVLPHPLRQWSHSLRPGCFYRLRLIWGLHTCWVVFSNDFTSQTKFFGNRPGLQDIKNVLGSTTVSGVGPSFRDRKKVRNGTSRLPRLRDFEPRGVVPAYVRVYEQTHNTEKSWSTRGQCCDFIFSTMCSPNSVYPSWDTIFVKC